jgi:hypothetical protein
MEYNDIWNDLCFRIKNKNRNAPERDFQIIAETLFEKLGWLQYKGEIITQKAIPVGSSNSIKPDIVIENNGQRLFVVELKKTNMTMSERNAGQLFSYMRLLKLNFGILLGETLQIYYELPNDNKPPIKINEISFDADSNDGIDFIKLLSKNEYSKENFEKYCIKKIEIMDKDKEAQKYLNILCSQHGTGIMIDLLRNRLSNEFPEEIIESIINGININITRKNSPINPGIGIKPPPMITPPPKENILTKIEAKNLCMKNGINLKGEITFASKNKSASNYWANPNIEFVKYDWCLILNDFIKHELHVFHIPAYSIEDDKIKVRSDDANKIDLQIKYEDNSFEDSRSGIQFVKWFIKTISY